ncbi:uncharacterized protein MELLADRAFT_114510 [Melampsora larici-populina 98AG31]|uniref:Uncharacterized protein n=1 Tax=Melampsora larici-populina (strain 98AG31 / pathotype 3-4-7) TaxID=747676 RepID=F4SDS1_MELLP|nr:uncharacterized protein MELLADRAFT_114510 [Melampsora larici-populina 98AG31]EGF97207.1 hypothetical protein MELLADRAFT_114510 [Melampsora larici-populina 98AG31]
MYCLQLSTSDWLLRRLLKVSITIKEAQATLDHWCQKANPYEPGRKYTMAFFRKQWESERRANIENSKDIKIRQQIELGRLLCLEDLHYKVWLEDGTHEERAADWLERVQQLGIEIDAQRQKVGLPDCFTHLSKDAVDLLLKVWFAKTEVRRRFLALRAEQRPLDPENRVGGSSHLDILPDAIQPFLEHNIISSASLHAKVSIVKGVLHNELTRVARLSFRWNSKIKEVFLKTEAQVGDMQLLAQWQLQLRKMEGLRSNGFGSTKAGDFEHLMPRVPVQHDIIPDGVREGGPEEPEDGDLSDINEEEWAQGIDEGMMQNIIHAVGNKEPS